MVDLNGRLRAHPELSHQVIRVGKEQAPVLVVDQFLSDPQALIDYAATHAAFTVQAGAFYPGQTAPIPPIYGFALKAFLGPLIREVFDLGASEVIKEKYDFSIITTPPERLHPLQRMPHIDNTDPSHFALLHYLGGPGHGGTSFYRHRATGFEVVDEQRHATYRQAIETELASLGPPPAGYILGDDPRFERIATFDGVFNRLLIYRGRSLHSADIGSDYGFDGDPRTGRLTANSFFYFS
ncbi:MAG: DUF6445 family protein [Phenylobacterium sp.]